MSSPIPFPNQDADVRQAYAEHLLYEAITYAIDQAKMTPEAVGKLVIGVLEKRGDRMKQPPVSAFAPAPKVINNG